MAAHESCTESIAVGREMSGDEGKDIQRNAVDGGESVPPFPNGYQRSCSVPVELRNGIQCEAAEARLILSTHAEEYATRFSSLLRAKTSC